MQLLRYLQLQGLGSKKNCNNWIKQEYVEINGNVFSCPEFKIIPEQIKTLTLAGKDINLVSLPYFYLLLNKPENHETSHNPQFYPSIFSLLPDNIHNLKPQAVGRLDADTTGLILITNDGQYNHYLTSPKSKISKIYEVTLKHPANSDLIAKLLKGVLLKDENKIFQAQKVSLEHPTLLLLEIQEGKYHQVKRMVAAAGNRVEKLHRIQFGPFSLGDLPKGHWQQTSKM